MTTSFPIILAHGITPFDRIMNPFLFRRNRDDDRFNYFRNIRSTLIKDGFKVFHSRVSWAAELDRRAQDLKDEIIRITDYFSKWQSVHIIAHSMGGLDSRLMIYKYRMEDHIASLTTIRTPHLGSSYADYGIKISRSNSLIFVDFIVDRGNFLFRCKTEIFFKPKFETLF